jgi:glycogen synthase
MRVLTVGNIHPPHDLGGGYEQDWAAGVAALQDAGHEVRVLTSDYRRADVAEPDPPWVARDLRWYWEDHEFPKRWWWQRRAIERANQRVMERELREFRPDVVSWWSMGGMSLALIEQVRGAGVPALGIVYDDWMVYGPKVAPHSPPLGAAARWLFASDSVRRAALGAQHDLADTDLLPPGLDELFLERHPVQEWEGRLLLPGRIDPRKGVATAIEAMTLLPDAHLELVGSGDPAYCAELKTLVDDLAVGNRVSFGPSRPRDELVRAYSGADAVLFPVTWAEPFGLVPLEAMGVGRPVVASGRGGSGEYLREGVNALLHEPDNAASLAAAVHRLEADAALRERLRAGGFETAPQYARSRWNERLVDEHERRVA